MKAVDTNYLVRLFTNRPVEIAQKVLDDLEKGEPKSILLPDFVVSELIYVLEFHKELSYKRAEIVEGIRLILSHPVWQVDNELHGLSLIIYEGNAKYDYVDCLVIALHKLKRVTNILTFDKEIQKKLSE